ncbi:MAG TPA: cell division protein ZapA [bacterium]|jgi:cell division protein ZapA|nr:cell division protein ZapA [bacterium]
MSEKKAVTVTIYGNEYTLKGEADPQYIAELAKFVDGKMSEIGKKSSAPAAKVAILASMNIADELHRLEKAKTENFHLIETLEKNLLEMKKSADGSLKHTMELKDQGDKLKGETSENRKKLEEAATELLKLKRESDQKTAEAEKAGKDLEEVQKLLGDQKAELEKMKKELETENRKSEDSSREANRLQNQVQTLSLQLEKSKEDLAAAEGLNDEAQAEIKDLKTKSEHMKAEFKQTQEHSEKNRQTPVPAAPSKSQTAAESFLPSEEKLKNLFKKIDAILE